MGDITSCVNKALLAKKLNKGEAKAFLSMSESIGVENAIADSVEIISQKKREAVITALRMAQADQAARLHPKGYATGLMSVMVRDIWGASKSFNVKSIEIVEESNTSGAEFPVPR